MILAYLINLTMLCGCVTVLWIISTRLKDVSIIDPFWGTGFVLVSWSSLLIADMPGWRGQLLVGMVTLWGLRLSLFLLWRNSGHGEDRRYAAMREHRGAPFWWISLFTVFLLQAVLLWFVALPLQAAIQAASSTPIHGLDVIGLAAWAVGLFFETTGDWQLARFKADPANQGKVMDRGLWRFTRHPNYFGDFCVWWGLYLVACSAGAAWTVASPILMSILLLRVSGVTLLESTIRERRPEYAEYQRRTNAFFPGPSRQ